MRLAHLSDLHLGGANSPRQLRRVLNLIDRVIDDGVDHLLLGGDLVDAGDLDDVLPLVRHLKRRRFFSADRLSVVPGNHDVWPFSERDLGRRGLSALLRDGKKLLTLGDWPAQETYERFVQIFRPTFDGVDRFYEDDVFPCVKRLDGIAVAMLDTTSDAGYLRSAQGRFDTREGRFVTDEVATIREPKILLMHHVPWRIGRGNLEHVLESLPWPLRKIVGTLGVEGIADLDFVNLAAVKRFIQHARFDAVLYGHVHLDGENARSRTFTRRLGRVPTYGMGRSGGVHQRPSRAIHAWHQVEVSRRRVRVKTQYVSARELD